MDKIKILFLAANPADMTRLGLDHEIRAITKKIRESEYRDRFELESVWAVRPGDLLQALNEHNPQVVHFSGHGSPTGEIVLVDRDGLAVPANSAAIEALFKTLKGKIRVVVLNACYSKQQAESITKVIECAIGMSKEIGDQAAIIFSAFFYGAVGFGRSIQEAFDQGVVALLLEGVPESSTPKLLTKLGSDPSSIFLVRTPDKETEGYQGAFEAAIVESYIGYMSDLLRDSNKESLGRLGRARTLEICRHLHSDGKAHVLRFIYDAGLIDEDTPLLDLHGIDLSEVTLVQANLAGIHLPGANLTRANLEGTDLTQANLTGANLTDSILKNAILTNAKLRESDLRRAVLDGADLNGAVTQAGYVVAGDDSIETDFDDLQEGDIYSFEVIGTSMEQASIYEGDQVVVKASHELPSVGKKIVTMYQPWGTPIIIGEQEPRFRTLAGPTIKTYQGKDKIGGAYRLQGWATKRKIRAKVIQPIGEVVTICHTSPLRQKQTPHSQEREWVDNTTVDFEEE